MNAENQMPENVKFERDLVYGCVDGRDLLLDLYWFPDVSEPVPLIVWVHGGAFRKGTKDNPQRAFHMLEKGYALASVEYRLSQEATFPAQTQDCKAAVRWLRAHAGDYHLDAERFGAWGPSAGGHLVAMLGTANDVAEWEVGEHLDVSSRVQAVCDWFGPTDFLRMNDVPGKMDHDAVDSPESQLVGAPIQDHPDLAGNANPISYASKGDPPFLIMHGAQDLTVIKNQSEFLNVALHEVGVSSRFVMLDDQGHGFGQDADIDKLVEGFFDEILKDEESAWIQENPNPWVTNVTPGAAGYRTVLWHNERLSCYYGYGLYLPPSYEVDEKRRFPVVYWLHGRNGSPNSVIRLLDRFDAAMREGRCPEMIIVAPNGLRSSMYCNSKDGQFPVETVIIEDLIPHIDTTYRTLSEPKFRVVDGFSMGGFGAGHLGFKYPELFGAVSLMGSAMHKPEYLRDERTEIFDSVFGGDLDYCSENVPWTLAEINRESIAKQVIRLYVGENDERLVEKNKDFHRFLNDLNVPHAFGIAPSAGHNVVQVHDHMPDDPFLFYRTVFQP